MLAPLALAQPAPRTTGKGLALDGVIVDLGRSRPLREDIQARNEGDQPLYVSVEPFLVVDPGGEKPEKRAIADPDQLGLLVTPRRFVLAPGAYRSIRVAALSPATEADRVYRITIKPEVGELRSDQSLLNVVVGYDVLAMVRPAGAKAQLEGARRDGVLTIHNRGNTNALFFRGRACDAQGVQCRDLPARRLYAGARWSLPLEAGDAQVEYHVDDGARITVVRY